MINPLTKVTVKAMTKLGLFYFTALSMLLANCILSPVIAWYRQRDLPSAIFYFIGVLAFNYLILGLYRLLRPEAFLLPPHPKTPASHSTRTLTE